MNNEIDPMDALAHFWRMAQHDHGGARVAAKLLLGLYNGARFPFDLTELRVLDNENHARALALLRLDAHPVCEVHDYLNRLYGLRDMGMRFEHLAHTWRLKGRCKREFLDPVQRAEFA